jgi:hypothetical protein
VVLKPRQTAALEINGWLATTIEIGGGYHRANGKLIYEPIRQAALPKWLARELRPILDKPDIRVSRTRRILSAVNGYALVGPTYSVTFTFWYGWRRRVALPVSHRPAPRGAGSAHGRTQ